MWIFTSAGFVSAVQHRDDENLLMVRGRDKESLFTMLQGIEAAGKANDEDYGVDAMTIYSEEISDYPWRVVVSKATFAIWVQFEILNYLNYHNFKNALTQIKGEKWHRAAMNVWTAMLAVEDVKKPTHFRPYAELNDAELNQLLIQEGIIDAEHDYKDMSVEELEDIHAVLVEMNSTSVLPKRTEEDIESYELSYAVEEGRLTYSQAVEILYPSDAINGYDGDPEEGEIVDEGDPEYYQPRDRAMVFDEGSETIPSEDWHYNEEKDRWPGYAGF